ncbi:MAG: TniB family NTP-binding protein [Solirubrobacterales bacterium]
MVEPAIDPAAGTGRLAMLGDTSTELAERILHIWRDFWVDYPVGNQVLAHLQSLYERPRTHRPPCCTIYGDTNSGKSHIALKFARDHKVPELKAEEQAYMPVVMVTNPPHGDLRGFYTATLNRIGAPFAPSTRLDRLLEQMLGHLTRLRTRMLIVDEIQHILAGKVDQRTMFMNCLKYLSNELQIPVVAVGTLGALRTLYSDPQLANRFESTPVPRWEANQDYAVFLTRLAAQMGLEKRSEFRRRDIVIRFHAMTEGLTGETRKLMGCAAETAIRSGREIIDPETLEATPWLRPGERKKGL